MLDKDIALSAAAARGTIYLLTMFKRIKKENHLAVSKVKLTE